MSQTEIADNNITGAERAFATYVPSLRRTARQPPPVAANGGLSYMSFDRNGDARTAVAVEEIARGEASASPA